MLFRSFAIGRAGLAAVQRVRDGRGPATSLAVPGLDPATLYGSPTLVDDVARFAPQVFAAASQGDQVAADIVRSAALDLAETITTALAHLPESAAPERVLVALTGGLFRAGEALLSPLRSALPGRAELVQSAGSPLDGAARLATGPPGPYADLVSIHRF